MSLFTFTPGQISTMSMVGQLGGMFTSAVGSYYNAASQKALLEARASVSESNARIGEIGAQSAIAQGQSQYGQYTQRAGQSKSSRKASMAARGIDLGEGSSAETLASEDFVKEIDAFTISANADRAAMAHRSQASNDSIDAMTGRASSSGISPGGAAFSSLLGNAGQVASSWYKYKKSGDLNGTWLDFG